MPRFRKVFTRAVLLGALVMGGAGYLHGGAAARPQQAAKTFTDSKYGYSFQYPSTWTLKKGIPMSGIEAKVAPTAVALVSADQNAVAEVLVHTGATSVAAIKKEESVLLRDQVTPLGPLTYSVKQLNGLSYPFSELVSKDSSGNQADAFIAATSHGKYTYYFAGALLMTKVAKATYNKHVTEIAGIVNSLSIK